MLLVNLVLALDVDLGVLNFPVFDQIPHVSIFDKPLEQLQQRQFFVDALLFRDHKEREDRADAASRFLPSVAELEDFFAAHAILLADLGHNLLVVGGLKGLEGGFEDVATDILFVPLVEFLNKGFLGLFLTRSGRR